MQGKPVHYRTKQTNPTLAAEAARDWWDTLRAKDKRHTARSPCLMANFSTRRMKSISFLSVAGETLRLNCV